MNRKAIEILAPVGGREQLMAAVRCGADAVYLGAKGFNARRNAENFDNFGLDEAVAYCHARGVAVHVTVNTLVLDRELDELRRLLGNVAASGADAVIVQDLAVAKLLRDCCPTMPLHASTQLSIHNLDGVKLARSLGFSRVVLARELSLEEIAFIARNAGDTELEVFVHGALCMSVSGCCYLSSLIGTRSGNRGLCAQPCRLDSVCRGHDYALSLKDLCLVDHLRELAALGVTSFKIEGRMKRPEYVAAAVTACRAAAEGKPYELQTLRDVFSRSGFTDGYLTAKRDRAMFGHRTREDAEASPKVFGQLAALYRNEYPGVPVDMTLTVIADKPAALTLTDGERTVAIAGAQPLPAVSAPTDEAMARRSLSRCGNTPFYPDRLTCTIAPSLILPAAELNRMRREGLEQLLTLRQQPTPKPFTQPASETPAPRGAASRPTLRLRFETVGQLFEGAENADRVILPVEELDGRPDLFDRFGDRLIGELPALWFGDPAPLRALLGRLREAGLTDLLCENPGALGLADGLGFALHGGACLNVTNRIAAAEYARLGLCDLTLSFELPMNALRALASPVPAGMIAAGRLPLMKLRACPARAESGCGDCDGRPTLTDRKELVFPLVCHRRRFTVLHNALPLWMGDRDCSGAAFTTLYFSTETADECRELTRRFCAGEPADGPFTRGLYGRELQ